jgi:hypothetical protein
MSFGVCGGASLFIRRQCYYLQQSPYALDRTRRPLRIIAFQISRKVVSLEVIPLVAP